MRGWAVSEAKEYCSSVRDGTHDSPKRVDVGRKLITSKHMIGDQLKLDEAYLISDEDFYEVNRRSEVNQWDVLISMIGTVGATFLVKEPPIFAIKNIGLFKTRSELEGRWLYYFLSSPKAKEDIQSKLRGTTQLYITLGELRALPIAFPENKQEMSEIVDILTALDDKIELNRKTAVTLEEMARALYRSWFVDFDPVHARSQGLHPAHMPPTTAALFPDSFGEDGLPEGWEFKRLGDLVKLNYGKALKKDIRMAGAFPVYGSGGSDSTHNVALISEPTIIVGRKGTVGSVRWAPSGCWPIDTAYYVTSDISLSYILPLIRELPLSEMNTDAAVPGLNRENAYRLEIPFPRNDIIETFVHLAGGWQAKQDLLTSENQTLATLRDTLLPRLMSGELRVGDARDQIKEAT